MVIFNISKSSIVHDKDLKLTQDHLSSEWSRGTSRLDLKNNFFLNNYLYRILF